MRPIWNCALTLSTAVLLAGSAQAGHIFFENVRINGVALEDNVGLTDPLIVAMDGMFDFEVDIRTTTGFTGFGDTLSLSFLTDGGTLSTPSNQSFNFVSNDAIIQTFGFTQAYAGSGTFDGRVTVNISGSSPDYIVPSSGSQLDSRTFAFTLESQPIPEPGTLALFSIAAGTALLFRRRRRT